MIPPLDLGPLRFGAPLGLSALLALAPVAWALVRAAAWRREADAAYGGPQELRRGVSAERMWLRAVLLVAALAVLALAIARPQWGYADQPVERRGIDVAIVLDISRSMSADDVEPTRAEAAAARLSDLLTHLQGDRVGLVTFGGTAFERSPLTTDLDALAQLIQRAQRESSLVRPGSDVARALNAALALLDIEDAAATRVIVLVSDGEMTGDGGGERLRTVLDQANRLGIRIYTVLAGSSEGGLLTDDPSLQEVSRADPARLREIATATGGDFREIEAAPGLAVAFRDLRRTLFERESDIVPIDRFQWFVAAGLALLVLHAAAGGPARRVHLRRRIASPAIALAGLVLVACAGTAVYRHVDAGNRAHEDGRYDDAVAAYEQAAELAPEEPAIPYNLANTLHEMGRFEDAAAAAAEALQLTDDAALAARIQYTQGANAFRRGLLEEARDAYVAVLRRDPDDQDAKANLELVLAQLAPPEQGSGEGQEGPSEEGGQTGEEAQQGGQGGEEPGGAQGEPGGDGGSGGSGDPQPGAAGQPGQAAPGQGGADSRTLEEALAALEQALAEAGDEITVEEALRILELARQANALEPLAPGMEPGARPAR